MLANLKKIISGVLQLGHSGPKLKNNSGVIENRNAADDNFVIVRGATPVGTNDLSTKNYVDTAANPNKKIQTLEMDIDNTASQSSVDNLPIDAKIVRVYLSIISAFSGGSTMDIGRSGDSNLIIDNTEIDITLIEEYFNQVQIEFGGSSLPILVTIGGSPVTGSAFLRIEYYVS